MRIFLLGGAGLVGQSVAEKFAKNAAVTEITIAGRNPEKAKQAALAIGEKANSTRADVMDEEEVARLIADYDIFVNTSGPDYLVQPHAVRAAINAGVNYCDVSCDGPAAEKVLELDKEARAAGMTAIIGIGWAPGLDNLMMSHAVHQLDETENVQACIVWPMTELAKGDVNKVVAELRDSGPYSASWETAMRCFSGQCRVFRDGKSVVVNSSENEVVVDSPKGGPVRMYPACGPESITVPRHLPGVKNASLLISFCPFPLNELAHKLASRIKAGEINTKDAAMQFIETAASDRGRWLSGAEEVPEDWPYWITAVGTKNGSRVRYTLLPDSRWPGTGGPLYTGATMLLKGEVKEHGILTPEACLDPVPFMEEVASIVPGWPPGAKLFEEKFEQLS